MRCLLIALFACLAYASSEGEVLTMGMEYTYKYDAQIVTGAPQSSKLTSGIRLSAELRLFLLPHQPGWTNTVLAQLLVTTINKMDKFVEDHTPMYFLQPEDKLLDGIEVDINKVMAEQLQKPFTFRYVSGRVSDIKFLEKDPEFSTNIKRGLISLFIVNLDRTYAVNNALNDKSVNYNPLQASYSVWEDSPLGYCLTTYTPTPSKLEGSWFYLTKVRQYNTCTEHPFMWYIYNNSGQALDKEEPHYNHLDMQGEVSYAIEGSKENFIIYTAVGQTKVDFVPYGRDQGKLVTSINQTLVLQKEEERDSRHVSYLKRPESRWVPDSLKMSLPVEMVQDLEPYVLSNTSYKPRNPTRWSVQKMQQLLTIIANGTYQFPNNDVLLATQTLVEMIRQSTNETLLKLYNPPVQPYRRLIRLEKKILWKLLESASTTSASDVLLSECIRWTNDYESATHFNKCISAVTNIGLYTPPSQEIIEKIIVLFKQSHREKALMEATALALGAIMGRAEDMVLDILATIDRQIAAIENILENGSPDGQEEELQQCLKNLEDRKNDIITKHTYIETEVFTALVSESDRKRVGQLSADYIVRLQALRNAQIPDSIYFIRRVLSTITVSSMVRVIAAQALETFDKKGREQAMEALELVQKNPTEAAAIRIQAFRSLLNLRPPVETLVRIASTIPNEQDRQVSTYIFSVFNVLSNSTFSPYRKLAGKLRASMPFMQPVDTGLQDSQYQQWMTTPAVNLSLLQEASYISDPLTNVITDTASYINIFGTTNKAFQVTMVSEGVQNVLTALFGAKGVLTGRASLLDLLKRSKRDVSIRDRILDIAQKLKIQARDLPNPKMRISVQVLNKVVRSYDLTTALTNLEELLAISLDIDEEKWSEGASLQYEMSGLSSPFYMEMRTEAGWPINMQAGVLYSINSTGDLSTRVWPSLYKDERGNQPPDVVTLRLAGKPQVVAALTGKMSVDGYLYQTGYLASGLISIEAPFIINITVNITDSRFMVSFTPPVSSSPIMKMEMKPYVYSQAVAKEIPKDNDINQNVNQRPIFITKQPVMISNGATLKQYQHSFGKYLLGYDVTYQAQYPWRALPIATATPLLGRSNFALYIRPGVRQPDAIVLDIKYTAQPRYKATVMRPTDSKPVKVGACDSWWFFWCYSTDESNAMDKNIQVDDSKAPPLTEPPNMDAKITVESVKQKFEKDLGRNVLLTPSASQWTLVAVLNTSTNDVRRYVSMGMLVQAWVHGRIHRGYLNVYRSPLPDHDPKPWTMIAEWLTQFPGEKHVVKDLVSKEYQKMVVREALTMAKRHKGNRFFEQRLTTQVSNYAMQRLPSLEPQVIIDRMVPEFVLHDNQTLALFIKNLQKTALPLSHQLRELKDRYKNSFAIQEPLLDDLLTQNLHLQLKVLKVLEYIQKMANLTSHLSMSTGCTLLKAAQATMDLNDIVSRLVDSSPLKKKMATVNKQQNQIYTESVVLANIVLHCEGTVGCRPEIKSMVKLIRQQLELIPVWFAKVMSPAPGLGSHVDDIISTTTANISAVNNLIKTVKMMQNKTLSDLLIMSSCQQQILSMTLQRSSIRPVSSPEELTFNSDLYALKVQTKQLLERGSLIQAQIKQDKICVPELKTSLEKMALAKLLKQDRVLMAVQHDRVTHPTQDTPWTGSTHNLTQAHSTLNQTLTEMETVRNWLLTVKSQPNPCLLTKMFDTLSIIQEKISIFKRILMAQKRRPTNEAKLFDRLDDRTMRYLFSLAPLFHNNYPSDSTDDQVEFDHTVFVTETTLKIEEVKKEEQRLKEELDRFFIQRRDIQMVEKVLSQGQTDTERILKQLTALLTEVESEMKLQDSEMVNRLYVYYVDALNDLNDIYKQMLSQYREYQDRNRRHSGQQVFMPEFADKVREKQQRVIGLMTAASHAALVPTTPSPTYTNAPVRDDTDFSLPIFDGDESEDSDLVDSASDEAEDSGPVDSRLLARPRTPIHDFNGILFSANISLITDKREVAIKVISRKSLAQNLWENSQFFPESRDDCVARAVAGVVASRPEQEKCTAETEARLNSYNNIYMTMKASGNLTKVFNYMDKVIRNFHHHNLEHATDLDADQTIPENSVVAVADFTPLITAMDLYYLKRNEGVMMESIPVMGPMRYIWPFQNKATLSQGSIYKASKRHVPPTCVLEDGVMRTVDGAVFGLPFYNKVKAPKRECRNLLAMDCSSDKTFAITGTPVDGPLMHSQMIQILAEQHEVELIPGLLEDQVKVDSGDNDSVPYPDTIVFTKQVAYGQEAVALKISRPYAYGPIQAEYPLVGLLVTFDYSYVSIQVSPVYKHKLCGMCGNYDGQLTKELVGPENRHKYFAATQDFCQSYKIEENMCKKEQPSSGHRSDGRKPLHFRFARRRPMRRP